ncbi:tetratricopeptide repeat-containing sensor histidine kinase [Pelobium sp.]|nr:tetratricopeptide repeat-containing sensor histidine kinase [Pelobium sp.]MDA9554873.1 tetratricopeptide repeat-containing sensor histidine kinase [Pelobium sp.]
MMIESLLLFVVNIFLFNPDTSNFRDIGVIKKDSIIKVYHQINLSKQNPKLIDEINHLAYEIHPSDYLKSFEFAKKSLELSRNLKYVKGEAESLHILGISFNYSENYIIADEYQDKCIALARQINDTELIARAFNAKGLAAYRMREFKLSHQYFESALHYLDKISKSHSFKSAVIHNIAALLDAEGKSNLAINFYNQAISLNIKNNNRLWLGQDYSEMAVAYRHLSNYQLAIAYSQKALTIAKQLNDPKLIVNNLNFLSNIYINFDEFDKAKSLLDKALNLSANHNLSRIRLSVLKNYANLAEKQKDFKSALMAEKNYNRLYDSLYNIDRYKQLDEFRTYFETEQKQRENLALKQANLNKEIKIQNKNYFILAIAALFLLGLYLFYLLYQNSKEIRRTNNGLIKQNEEINKQKEKLEELNQLKTKFFSIISHDLRSPLISLKGMFSLFENSKLEEAELKNFMRELEINFKNTSNLVDNLLVWAKSQMQGEVLQKKRINLCKISDENVSLLKIQYQNRHVQIINQLQFCYAYADEESISVVIRNLLSNAVKFTPNDGKITLNSKKTADKIIFCVNDTGIGMDSEEIQQVLNHNFFSTNGVRNEKGSGLGLMLCQEFIKKNDGEFWIESEKGNGSCFCFSLPLKS